MTAAHRQHVGARIDPKPRPKNYARTSQKRFPDIFAKL
jgi:hypothetical protein